MPCDKKPEQLDYYHKVVDCQYACPTHTPVPQYIRLVAQGRYDEAYRINRDSNVFPGILGRICDRPCEPACRRSRLEQKSVAICRLKRVAADLRSETPTHTAQPKRNGKKIALIGAGPASLTVANDLLPRGYQCVLFEKEAKPGGAMLSQVPSFRLPQRVLDEEIAFILNQGAECHFNHPIERISPLIEQYDAIFIGTGAPKAKDLRIPGRNDCAANIYLGIEFLANVHFEHIDKLGKNVVVIGGGNTAMDCCRTAKRLGARKVSVITPEGFADMLASPWEKEDAIHEGISFYNNLLPAAFHPGKDGRLSSVSFRNVSKLFDEQGKWSPILDSDAPRHFPCDDVILAIGQGVHFPFVDDGSGLEFSQPPEEGLLIVDKISHQTSNPKIFAGGDAAWGPKNIIWSVAHGHEAAISIDLFCQDRDPQVRPMPQHTLTSTKMALNRWNYDNDYSPIERESMPEISLDERFHRLDKEVELGFSPHQAAQEAARCLNCDVQTVFEESLCIECDACIDICPVECLVITPDGEEQELRARFPNNAINNAQAIFKAEVPQTGRVMIKDENICLHCGLCSERCPTEAWDMQEFTLQTPRA